MKPSKYTDCMAYEYSWEYRLMLDRTKFESGAVKATYRVFMVY